VKIVGQRVEHHGDEENANNFNYTPASSNQEGFVSPDFGKF
jgi:hypothetical protein